MTGDDATFIEHWTAYWRTGRSASCFQGSDVEANLVGCWHGLVDELTDGARLLDLATGNGTVARSCAARARARNVRLHIEAIDAAEIDPTRYVADPQHLLRDVRFHGGVRLEGLPFPAGAFDALVSQFGFEYAAEEAAASEAARVLAPSGRLRLVLHARDGAVSRDIGGRLERLRTVLAENGPVELVLSLARAAERRDFAALRSKEVHLTHAIEIARKLAQRPPPEDAALFYAGALLQLWAQRERYWPADLRRSVEEAWTNACGVATRQEQMLRVACSAEGIARISGRFAAGGLSVEAPRAIRDDRRGVQIAWLLDARKLRKE